MSDSAKRLSEEREAVLDTIDELFRREGLSPVAMDSLRRLRERVLTGPKRRIPGPSNQPSAPDLYRS